MYVKIKDNTVVKFPYSIANLRADYPSTSFPKAPTPETLASFGVYKVAQGVVPSWDDTTHVLGQSVQQIDGVWTQVWEAKKRPESEATKNIRRQRDMLLAECDWTQVVDATVDKAAWLVYRQALRDITAQEGFPWGITWPEKP